MSFDFLKEITFKKIFSIKDNGINLFGKIDYITLQSKAWASVLQKIGSEKSEEYLFNLGFEAGDNASKEMITKLKWNLNYPILGIKGVQYAMNIIGFGIFKLIYYEPEKGNVMIHVKDNPVIESGKELFGDKSKICVFYRGVYSGHGINEGNIINCHLEETSCICKGGKYCEWVSGPKFKNEK